MVVGAPQSNSAGEDSGAAYGYRYVNDVWQFESKLIASDATAGDNFAAAALVTPGFILIGAPRADGMNTESGAVYDFRFDGNQWIQQDKLVAADGRTGDLFGASLDYADFKPRATIGAPGTDERGPNSGAVYLFRPVGDAWVEAAKVLPAPDSQNRYFGSAVAADRELLVVGQPRADDAGPDSRRASAYDTN